MANHALTFEEIDKHIQTHAAQAAPATAATGAAAIPNVCKQYQTIRPILIALQSFPFIPKKWRDAIQGFTTLMDGFCPTP